MKVKVEDKYDFDVQIIGDDIEVNGTRIELDQRNLSGNHTHFIYQHKSYNAEIISENKAEKTCQVKVNGNIYEVKLEDRYDELLKRMGMDTGAGSRVKEVKAPMPGLVLSILTTAGQEVSKGDGLMILEAMKMENIIKSPADGTIKKINILKGDKVEKNQILIEFE
ncbi:MAG TPA: biotin/lipoyl-containing protein [Pedobacter sp.]|nr:biotin/lipoyl-containing protein [Pedobacter sp.]